MGDFSGILVSIFVGVLVAAFVWIIKSMRHLLIDPRARNYYATNLISGQVQTELLSLSLTEQKSFDARSWYESSDILEQAQKKADKLKTYCGFCFDTLTSQHLADISYRFDVQPPSRWHVMQCVPQSGDVDEWVVVDETAYTNSGLWAVTPHHLKHYQEIHARISIDPYLRLLESNRHQNFEFVQIIRSHFLKLTFIGPFGEPALDRLPEPAANDPQTHDQIDVFINCKNLNVQKVDRIMTFRSALLAENGAELDEEAPDFINLRTRIAFLGHDLDISVGAPEWVNAALDDNGQLVIVDNRIYEMPFF